jgi:hypothetical protein
MAKPAVVKECAWPDHIYGIFTPNWIPGPCSAWHVSVLPTQSAVRIVWFYLWNDVFILFWIMCLYLCLGVGKCAREQVPGEGRRRRGLSCSFTYRHCELPDMGAGVGDGGGAAARRCLQEPYQHLPDLSLSLSLFLSLSLLCDYALWGENRVAQWVFCLFGFERRAHDVILTGLAFTV